MRARILTAAGIAAAVILGSTGCTFLSRQATTISYDAADQVSVNLGDVQLRGLLVLGEEGSDAVQLTLVAINDSDVEVTLHYSYDDTDGGNVDKTLVLQPNSTQRYGFGDHEQILLDNAAFTIGGNIEIYFQAGSAAGVLKAVPVLNSADWHQYEDLAPIVIVPTEPSTIVDENGDPIVEPTDEPTTEAPTEETTTEEHEGDADH